MVAADIATEPDGHIGIRERFRTVGGRRHRRFDPSSNNRVAQVHKDEFPPFPALASGT
jgi:hypothetical protein